MKELPILWQRLVIQGETCPRCADTGAAVLRAVERLRDELAPLGITPVLETRELSAAEFHGDPAESNRIWIAGRSLEDWLQGQVGRSPCCRACGTAECRTVEIGGTSYAAIPEELLIKAALIAARAA